MNTYKRHRFPSRRPPPDIISYAVWLYYRFNFRHRDIEDLLAERGITVIYECIRLWYPPKVGALGEALATLMGQGGCVRPGAQLLRSREVKLSEPLYLLEAQAPVICQFFGSPDRLHESFSPLFCTSLKCTY